jgi:hypothetical protein
MVALLRRPLLRVISRGNAFNRISNTAAPRFFSSHTPPVNPRDEAHRESLSSPSAFWGNAAKQIDWVVAPTAAGVLTDNETHTGRWFHDGVLNTCYNCVDRHIVNGLGEKAEDQHQHDQNPHLCC